jgi:hypothetical protein
MNRSDRGKASLASLLVLATVVACSSLSATPVATGSRAGTPVPSTASPSAELLQSAETTPSGGITLVGTPGPTADPTYLPGKTTDCSSDSAIALANGKILTWGCPHATPFGYGLGAALFDPTTGIFTPTGSSTIAFQEDYQPPNPAVLLKSGQVYFPNGETYDPSTGRFYPTPVRLASSTATLLPDGRVFVLAYDTTDPDERVAGHVAPQIYDPRTGNATPTGPMPLQLDGTAVTLADGQVLVMGPAYPLDTRQALLYDPASNAFTKTGSTVIERTYQSCITTLQDGRLLVAGDFHSPVAEVYSPATGLFTKVAPMIRIMGMAVCATLADGRVLVLGVVLSDQDSTAGPLIYAAQIYDPKANRWTNLGHLAPKLYVPSVIALPDGRAVVLGGQSDTVQFFDPKTNKFVANG